MYYCNTHIRKYSLNKTGLDSLIIEGSYEDKLIKKIIFKFIEDGLNLEINDFYYKGVFEENIKMPDKITKLNYDIWVEKFGVKEANRRKEMTRKQQSKTNIERGVNKGEKNWMYGLPAEANPMFGRTPHDIWVEKFGRKEADKKQKEQNENQKAGYSKDPMDDRSIYNGWVEKLGVEEANKKLEKMKQKMRENNSGKNNPNYRNGGVKFKKICPYCKNKFETHLDFKIFCNDKCYHKSRIGKKGKKHTEESKKKMSKSVENLSKIYCEHCHRWFAPGMFKRWHGDNCKKRNL